MDDRRYVSFNNRISSLKPTSEIAKVLLFRQLQSAFVLEPLLRKINLLFRNIGLDGVSLSKRYNDRFVPECVVRTIKNYHAVFSGSDIIIGIHVDCCGNELFNVDETPDHFPLIKVRSIDEAHIFLHLKVAFQLVLESYVPLKIIINFIVLGCLFLTHGLLLALVDITLP